MDSLIYTRSKALNTVSLKKVQEKISTFISNCDICSKNTGVSADGLCKKCSTNTIIFNRYYEANIPIEYWNLKMDKDFVGDKRLFDKYNEIASDINSSFVKGTSVCFAGNYGIGKSMAMISILKKAIAIGYNCLYTTFGDIVNTLTQAPNEDKFLAKKELTMVDFLVIDEVDSRFIGSESMSDLYARQLEYVLRSRRQNQHSTF